MDDRQTIWADIPQRKPAALETDLAVEIAVVGAGMAGLTAGYVLARRGYDVHIIDDLGPGAGMTGRSTAHIANAIDDGWRALVRRLGVRGARLVAQAYTAAHECIDYICKGEDIACDFRHVDGCLVATPAEMADLLQEKQAAARAGVKDVDWAPRTPFPGSPDTMALRFAHQARLHPLKYAAGLARCIVRDGGRLHRARVTGVTPTGRGTHIATAAGHTVTATRAVVLATNTALRFASPSCGQKTNRSYVIAAALPKGAALDAVCWDLADPYHYTRLQPGADSDLLIAGGEDHDVTEPLDTTRFRRVEHWARGQFPALGTLTAMWSGTLKQTSDNLAFLGPTADPGIFVIDGDGGLGFTHATVGALIIRDAITGAASPWAKVFDPLRFGAARHGLVGAAADPRHVRTPKSARL